MGGIRGSATSFAVSLPFQGDINAHACGVWRKAWKNALPSGAYLVAAPALAVPNQGGSICVTPPGSLGCRTT